VYVKTLWTPSKYAYENVYLPKLDFITYYRANGHINAVPPITQYNIIIILCVVCARLPGVDTYYNRCWILYSAVFCRFMDRRFRAWAFPRTAASVYGRVFDCYSVYYYYFLFYFILFFSVRDAYYNRSRRRRRRPAQEECRITKLSLIHIILYIISDNKMHTDVRAHLRGGRPSSACVYEYLHRCWGRGYSPRNKTRAPGEVDLEKNNVYI